MKIEQVHIEKIRTAFQNMQSKEDLLQLMNEVKPLIYGEKTVLFQMKQLTWYSNPKLAKKRYTSFTIKKKSGAERTIHTPVNGLKAIQKTLSFILQCVYEPHKAATGFVREKSIVDNAKEHVGNQYVFNIDLKDFFSSIDQARVWKCLQLKPFNLSDTKENLKLATSEGINYNFDFLTKHYSNPNKKSEKFIRYYYVGYNFRNGLRNHVLKNGEIISYSIKLNEEKTSGFIDFYCDRNNLSSTIQTIKNNYNEKLNLNDFSHIFFDLIKLHQGKIKATDNRTTIANIMASLCCNEMEVERMNSSGEWEIVKRNVLPQGAPTSPILTNVVCQRLDYLLSAVAKRFGLKYTRYADDITFSSMHNVYQSDSDFIKELHRIIAEQGFHIKETKTRIQKEGYRKEVTGLLVNDKVNVQKRYIKQLRMWLYYWETYGYERAQNYFVQHYLSEKTTPIKGKPDMVNVIDGKLNYLKMVKGGDNELYLKLRYRFCKLTNKQSFISKVLNAWEAEGIESAMELYYSEKFEITEELINKKADELHIFKPKTNDIENRKIKFNPFSNKTRVKYEK